MGEVKLKKPKQLSEVAEYDRTRVAQDGSVK